MFILICAKSICAESFYTFVLNLQGGNSGGNCEDWLISMIIKPNKIDNDRECLDIIENR